MRKILRLPFFWCLALGYDPRRTVDFFRALPGYLGDWLKLRRQYRESNKEFPCHLSFPCPHERRLESGSARGHYFHQDFLVARRVFAARPERHEDVGSRVDGFARPADPRVP